MIVDLDTNVLVAAMVAKGLCHEVVVRSLGSCTVATSQPLLDELEHTLRAKFTLGPAGMAFLKQLRLRVRIVEPTLLSAPVSRDADDDRVLATAVAAGAAVIVTGDQDLLVIDRCRMGSKSPIRFAMCLAAFILASGPCGSAGKRHTLVCAPHEYVAVPDAPGSCAAEGIHRSLRETAGLVHR